MIAALLSRRGLVATLVLILLGVPIYPLFHGKGTASKRSPAPEPSA